MEFFKDKTFAKYFVSYITILLIPLLISYFFVSDHMIGIMQTYVEEELQGKTKQIADRFDKEIIDVYTLSTIIADNDILHKPTLMNMTALDEINLKDTLTNAVNANSIIYDGLVYLRKNNKVYSVGGVHRIDDFLQRIYIMTDDHDNKFKRMLSHIGEPTFLQERNLVIDTNQKSMLMYLAPFPLPPAVPEMTIAFLINKEPFQEVYKNLFVHNQSTIYIYDQTDNVICTLGDDSISSQRAWEIYQTNQSATKEIVIDNDKYYYSAINSNQTNWKYLVLCPYKLIMHDIFILKTKYIALLLSILTVSLLIILFFVKMNYYPIKELMTISKSIINANPNNDSMSYIKSAMDQLITRRESLNEDIDYLQREIKALLIRELLTGSFKDKAKFNAFAKKNNFQLLYENIIVICVKSNNDDLAEYIEQCLKDKEMILISGRPFNLNHIYTVVSCNCSRNIDFIDRYRNELKDILLYDEHSVFISNALLSIHNIPYAMAQIVAEMDNTRSNAPAKVVAIQSPDERPNTLLTDEVANKILNLIIDKKSKQTMGLLRKIIECEKQSCISVDTLKNDINHFILSIQRANISYQNQDISSVCKKCLKYCINVNTKDDCINLLKELGYELIELSNKEKVKGKSTISIEIKNYVDSHIYNTNFCLQNISDALNVSTSYISRVFKASNDAGLSEYIKYCRIKKAKEYLTDTDIGIKEIASMVGYNDVSHFIRVFKSVEFITPKAYRNSYTKKKK